jgi:hypothetical protein
MAQVVLLSKCETLSSNPSTTHKKITENILKSDTSGPHTFTLSSLNTSTPSSCSLLPHGLP